MKAALLPLLLFLPVSCRQQMPAVVHSSYAATPPVVGMADFAVHYVASAPAGVLTGYKLQQVAEDLPQKHEDFVLQPSYPLTHSVWMNPLLMQKDGSKLVRILLGKQRGLYLVDGEVAMDFPVCTGRGAKSTPAGRFRIIEKQVEHRSNLYDCPMPYFMRLTWSGIGMHVGDVYRNPASHGCIRLPQVACEPLFRALPYGSRVEITQ